MGLPKTYGAQVYGIWFMGHSVKAVHDTIERYEIEYRPHERVQSYTIQELFEGDEQ